MDRDELTRRLMGVFLGELEEHLRSWDADLLGLEHEDDRSARTERLRSLFRTAHSLKGASRSVGIAPVEQLCRALEERLAELQRGSTVDAATLHRLLVAGDALREAAATLRRGEGVRALRLPASLEALDERPESRPAPHGFGEDRAPKVRAARDDGEDAETLATTALEKRVAETRDGGPPPRDVRVPLEALDEAFTWSGELRIARSQLVTHLNRARSLEDRVRRMRRSDRNPTTESLHALERGFAELHGRLSEDLRRIDHAAEELDHRLRKTRMLPFEQACEGLERAARDAARSAGKRVRLVVQGGEVFLDRAVVDVLHTPLLHLVRNAVGHGVETAEVRRERGKDPVGRVEVTAQVRGAEVDVTVCDDGAGIDLEAVRTRAEALAMDPPEAPEELARLVFHHGFTTASEVNDISGRGIGLDVVKSEIESIHGGIDIHSEPGVGTTFLLSLPLTLGAVRCVLFEVHGHVHALATTSVAGLRRIEVGTITHAGERPVAMIEGAPVPFALLAGVLAGGRPALPQERTRVPVVLAQAAQGTVALGVDALLEVEALVLEALPERLAGLPFVGAVTTRADGSIVPILSGGDLVRAALAHEGRIVQEAPSGPARPRRLLVVDDSVTTRTLEKTILEGAGYQVTTAADGAAAWRLLREREVDLVVTDVEMPEVDGFELTERIRASPRLRDVPVVLLTALERPEDRERGLQAGASAYLLKNAFDQRELLETLRQLL